MFFALPFNFYEIFIPCFGGRIDLYFFLQIISSLCFICALLPYLPITCQNRGRNININVQNSPQIARYCPLLVFQEIYRYDIQHLSAKGGFTGFSGNKCLLCPLKIYSKEIKNQYNQSGSQTKQQRHSWTVNICVEFIFQSARPIILLNLYVIIDCFIIPLNDLTSAIAFTIAFLAFQKGFR